MVTSDFEDTQQTVRGKKADKPFSPPELGLRPGSFGIVPRLYEHVKTSRNDWMPKNVYASQLKSCVRQQAFGLLGFPKVETEMQKENPQWNVVADFGSSLHELVESWLKKLGISVKSEYRVRAEHEGKAYLTGRVDHRVRVGEVELDRLDDSAMTALVEKNSREAILDVKTVGSKDFKQGAWSMKIPGFVAQLQIYMHLEQVKLGIILLVNRDSGEMLELEFDYNEQQALKLLRRAKGVVDWAAEKRLPPAEEWGGFGCKAFCPFFAVCEAEVNSAGAYKDEQDRDIGVVQAALYAGKAPKEIIELIKE